MTRTAPTVVGPAGSPEPSGGWPTIIQGGMGVGVSGWRLAQAVASTGQLGVVSGVALDTCLARRLQDGDPDGLVREALDQFPFPDAAKRILDAFFVEGGIPAGRPYRPVPRLGLRPHKSRDALLAAANFVEVFLAKRGHDGPVGINYLEKLQLATPASVYGAMLAGVDYVLMGAGIPTQIPRLLTDLAAGGAGGLDIAVEAAGGGASHWFVIDPADSFGASPRLTRPRFLAVVSSHILAGYLAKDEATRPDGFVVEGSDAGGHSAPPRRREVDEFGSPLYGPRDVADLTKMPAALPFFLAGGYGRPERLAQAKAAGAQGVQVGTPFAMCRESGLSPELRHMVLTQAVDGSLRVRNAAEASPTGFPFKVASVPGTLSEPSVYEARERFCDMGYLRTPYQSEEGRIGYRCTAEPVDIFIRKGGEPADAEGRRCLCNALVAAIGLEQTRPDGYVEPPVVTLGQDLAFLPDLLATHGEDFSAADIVEFLLRDLPG